ncbi:FtsK/SpoIIIE domain-containing protein [Cryobacterium tepidiphilum]|uniref:Cell division protein FtsK n=1 Tax=Cryobacterium tepidiphilum TaxID=2486026 RepID=A0A3M8LDX4_9MICO|nr:FtsK/SpoIIIE domain-containing protein [Cryobacterium tepidiphilum]RNE63676.1 cell division protein FtsK [Cryobacterium tepidiphilum]
MIASDRTFHLPAAPPAPARPPFPVVATLAPLAVSALIFAITGSAYVLLFAALGPVIAVATIFDGRRAVRRAGARRRAATSEAFEALRTAVGDELERLRAEARDTAPDAASILSGQAELRRWAARPTDERMPVVLGAGTVPSGIRFDGGGAGPPADGIAAEERADEEELRRFAAELTGVPLAADVAGGVGIVGPLALGRAVARALLVQVAHLYPPGRVGFRAPDGQEWAWLDQLPHALARSPATLVGVCEPGHRHDACCLLALSETVDRLPPGCGSVLQLRGTGAATIVRRPGRVAAAPVRTELVSVADAAGFAVALAAQAERAGLVGSGRVVPAHVSAADLWGEAGLLADTGGQAEPRATATLECPIGRGAAGTVTVDLVGAGPHAVVGGTTGSGKSELLVTWVTSMAAAYPPEQVTFLLVDFKGGSAFTPLIGLPHCVGLVTDLDDTQAARALTSLRAEVRHRERILRDARARDITDAGVAGRLPRLVIVVDEFQAMLGAFDDLHMLFTDLAARGRSLGIHLILCTQRPAGVVRDALLANCTLRLSLRVNNRSDSVAVLGVPDAADLRAAEPGRCLLAAGEGAVGPCQVAVTREEDIAQVAHRSRHSAPPRRPWLEPLPPVVTMADLAGRAADVPGRLERDPSTRILGLLDEPEEQRYRIAAYRPGVDGHLLVIGGAGSGKSGLVASLAAQGHGLDQPAPRGVEGIWDALEAGTALLDRAARWTGPDERDSAHQLLLLDDFDAVFARWAPDYQAAAVDRLGVLLRQGREAGLTVVITVQRLGGQLGSLAALCPETLLLRLPHREEHRAAGGDPARYDPALPPGGGYWRGSRVQLVEPPRTHDREPGDSDSAVERISAGRAVLVVSSGPARTAAELRARRGGAAVLELGTGRSGQLELQELGAGTALVGDPDAWQAHFGLLAALRTRTDIVFDGCTLGDYRLISRRRDLPPALAPHRARLWLLGPDGEVRRAVWE